MTAAPRISAVLCVRDEGPFLIDWLAHHRACGVTDVLAFSNDCRDGTDLMLDRLAAMGWVTHIRNDGPHPEGPQWAALKLASRHPVLTGADWAIVLDIDEYLNIHMGDRTIPALLDALPQATAIALQWRLFGNDGVVEIADDPVTERFVRAAPRLLHWPWRAQMVKTLWRPGGAFRRAGVHRPRQPDPARLPAERWFDGSGRALPAEFVKGRLFLPLGQDNVALAQVNHYALGSIEDFLLKCDRGRANRDAAAFDAGYWLERNFSAEDELSIHALRPRSAPLRRALRDDPVLARLHRAALDWRRARLGALLADEAWRGFLGRLMLSAPARLLTEPEARRIWGRSRAPAPSSGNS